MAAGNTYTMIATQTVTGSSAGTVVFSSIPSTYTDLVMVCHARGVAAVGMEGSAIRFNGDTAANYSQTELKGDGASAASSRNTGDTYIRNIDAYVGSTAASGIFGFYELHVMNYANTTTYKTTLGRSSSLYSGAGVAHLAAGLWRSTAAINSITHVGYNGNIDVGSTFTLYGISCA